MAMLICKTWKNNWLHRKNVVLVSLMHANNEIGNLLDIEQWVIFAIKYNAIFHSDCVQTVGHYPMDLRKTLFILFLRAGHKFHGPKGAGVLYINDNIKSSHSSMVAARNAICGPALKTFMALWVLQRHWNWQWQIMKKTATIFNR